jgi:hypothetical protein
MQQDGACNLEKVRSLRARPVDRLHRLLASRGDVPCMPASFYSFFSLKILKEKLPPDVTTKRGIFMLSHDNNDFVCVCFAKSCSEVKIYHG